MEKDDASNEAAGATVTCNNEGSKSKGEASSATSNDTETLIAADELIEKGSMAVKSGDLSEAVDLFSRALEIRVQHYGELAPECVKAYYKYGLALLYKAQDEADPLGSGPKGEPQELKDINPKSLTNGESSTTSVSSNAPQDGDSKQPEALNVVSVDVLKQVSVPDHLYSDSNGKDQEDDDGDDSDEDNGDGEEDDSDLDLAWKMLDVARAILEKVPGDTIEKVDILSALAEVALEREDIETSLSDYLSALSILERLVEPDSRLIAELTKIPLVMLGKVVTDQLIYKVDEAIPYCQKAITICKTRVERLKEEVNSKSEIETSTAASDNVDQGISHSGSATSDKEAEIETLTGLASELEKKLEDLQQSVANPSSVLSEIMEIMASRGKGNANGSSAVASSSRLAVAGSSGGETLSATVSTAHTNGTDVTNLGVVGRGVKRVSTNSENSESKQVRRIAPTPVEKTDGPSSNFDLSVIQVEMVRADYLAMKTDPVPDSIGDDLNELKNAAKRLVYDAARLGGLGFGTSFLKWVASFSAMSVSYF
ncbi:unnamed protein product [Rhodiola kirilowii]